MFGSSMGRAAGMIVEYRCRVGHAYSPLGLKEEEHNAAEKALWTIQAYLSWVNMGKEMGNIHNHSDLHRLRLQG
jgi:hypothetical protein